MTGSQSGRSPLHFTFKSKPADDDKEFELVDRIKSPRSETTETTPALKPRQCYLAVLTKHQDTLVFLKQENNLAPLTKEQLNRIYTPDDLIDETKWAQLKSFTVIPSGKESALLYEQSFYQFLKETDTEKNKKICGCFFSKDSSNKQEWAFYWTLLSGEVDKDHKQLIKIEELRKFLENPEPYFQTYLRKRALLFSQEMAPVKYVIPRLEF
ncbi:MAG TPA: hypothetical protein VLJ15_03735 [Gammaproteobacteria bacterium]|nr:hypothetical protein [Gammaproteobacteria bacterium]